MLTSTRHPRVLAAKRLTRRAGRLADRRFLVEGPQAVRELLAAGAPAVLELFTTGAHPELAAQAAGLGAVVTEVSEQVLGALADTVTPQGVVAVAELLDTGLHRLPERPLLVVGLVEARDPGNAGTVIRTADAAGAAAVLLLGESVDPHNGKAVRASTGSAFHLPVLEAPVDLALAAARAQGLQVLATSGAGQHDLDDLADSGALAAPTLWLLGNEARGLPDDLLARADRTVRVPIHGRAESLNLATAAAVCLYASARAQRGLAGRPQPGSGMIAPRA